MSRPRMAGPDTVWNIGVMTVRPGAANVVPSEAELVVEFRDTSSELLGEIEARILGWVKELDGEGGVRLDGKSVKDPQLEVPCRGSVLLEVGKRRIARVVFD